MWMISLYRTGHFCGMFYIDGEWWLYDPLTFEKGIRMKKTSAIPGEYTINCILYGKI